MVVFCCIIWYQYQIVYYPEYNGYFPFLFLQLKRSIHNDLKICRVQAKLNGDISEKG